ncbi:MAG: pyruvate formate lyase family protein [Chloroflexota bacterium]
MTIEMTKTATREQRIWDRVFAERDRGGVSLERARLLTASWKETDGLPTPVRRAMAFAKIMAEIPIYIDDGQLFVGDFSAKPQWAEWYPEFSAGWVLDDMETEPALKTFHAGDLGHELKEIAEYWQDKCVDTAYFSLITPEQKERWANNAEDKCYIYRWLTLLDRLGGYHVVNYEKPIKEGFLGILHEVESEIAKTRIHDDDSLRKVQFLKGCAIVLKGAMTYAQRYAALAREMAQTATGARKAELEQIARTCEWVPAHPARSFREAVQTLLFVHVLIYLETRTEGESPGRADQYLYPYYQHDIEEGTLTREAALEMLGCFRIKLNGLRQFSSKYFSAGTSGEAQFHNITLGGLTADGEDATNELSYLFLEAALRLKLPHPTLSIRWHEKLPEDFALKGLEVCATGVGYPAFFNDDAHMAYMQDLGASLEEARGYAVGGCVVPVIPGAVGPGQPIVVTNPKALELALYNGVEPYVSGEQVGVPTGKFEDFQTYEELVDAYNKQIEFFSEEAANIMNAQRTLRDQMICPIMNDIFVDDCIKRGKSSLGGGSRYQINYINARGVVDTADSLAAIKKCVFEDKTIGRQELLDALKNNFKGREDLRKRLLDAPKFGNDDDYVDQICADLFRDWHEIVTKCDAGYGAKYLACSYSVGGHVPAGAKTGALPSGRLAGKALADGSVSPCQGADVKGPSAVINSCAKIDQSQMVATLLNMKFLATIIKTTEDRKKLYALIRTYFEDGGKHVQFNTVDRKTLLDAQQHPERHRSLIVRVSGYSAFFTELSSKMQDEIIARTEHEL